MKDKIIYIKGAAFPKRQGNVAHEMDIAQEEQARLRESGCTVISIGTAWRGFYKRHLHDYFDKNPDANLIYLFIHGNGQDGAHTLSPSHAGTNKLLAKDFYSLLAEASGQRPLNVFTLSCGSSHGALDAIQCLPEGSTMVSMFSEQSKYDYVPYSKAFSLPQDPEKTLSERLFLNILAKGYDETTPRNPSLNVASGERKLNASWNLWDAACFELPAENTEFGATFVKAAQEYLRPYFSAQTVYRALTSIEQYHQAYQYLNAEEYSHPSTSVTIKVTKKIDHEKFVRDMRKEGLFDAAVAVAYYANRELMGAFQTQRLSKKSSTLEPA